MTTEDNVLQAFRLIDLRIAEGAHRDQLQSLKNRLAGELLGDADLVAETLAPDFELVTHVSGVTAVTGRDAIIAGIQGLGQANAGTLMWIELDALVCDRDAIAGHGALQTLGPDVDDAHPATSANPQGLRLTTMPLALFLRFDGNLMSSEVIYLDPAATRIEALTHASTPSPERLRDVLALESP
jgi:hypothetical protein